MAHREIQLAASGAARWFVFSSRLGWMALRGGVDRVGELRIGYTTEPSIRAALDARPLDRRAASDLEKECIARLREYAAGARDGFLDIEVDEQWATPFQRKVLRACRRIDYGETLSYSELAGQIGATGAARAVGSALARNRCPIIVPCHRVLAAGRWLGGFSAPRGPQTKRRLLRLEGAVWREQKKEALACS